MQDVIAKNNFGFLPSEARAKWRWTSAALLSGVSLAILWILRDRFAFNYYDEGVIAYGAQRLLQGDVPYRDFWVLYPPGQFLAIAALFKLFGSSLIVERAWDIALRAAIASLGYLITARLAPRRYALLTWAMSLLWLQAIRFYGYPLIPALLLTLVSIAFFIGFLQSRAIVRNLFMAGLFIGVLVAFRHDIASYVFLAEGLAIFGVFRVERRATRPGAIRWRNLLTAGTTLCAGIAVGFLPVLVYLLASVTLADLLEQLIVFPATVYPVVRSLPYPSILHDSFRTAFPY